MFNIIIFSTILFIIGLLGILNSKQNSIVLLICLELLILAININFTIGAIYLDDLLGLIYSSINLTGAASESAIGLASLIIFYRIKGGISLDLIILSKG